MWTTPSLLMKTFWSILNIKELICLHGSPMSMQNTKQTGKTHFKVRKTALIPLVLELA